MNLSTFKYMPVNATISFMETLTLTKGRLATSDPLYFLDKYGPNGKLNKLQDCDTAMHGWYRFVLSYPPHLVRDYLRAFDAKPGMTVLDPFCGTGTTLIEAKKNGINSIGIEANPLAHFASTVKVNWLIDPIRLINHTSRIAEKTKSLFEQPLKKLAPEQEKLLLKDSISQIPLHKTLILLELINQNPSDVTPYELLALAKATVFTTSNLHFGPEVGVRGHKEDADVLGAWLKEMRTIANDLHETMLASTAASTLVFNADARELSKLIPDRSIDFVITSPPYPNEKDYTRTTRLESILLDFIRSKEDLRRLKRGLVRSNTRSIYKADTDDMWVKDNQKIQNIADQIERRRIELGKTSGFEKNYARVTKLYFGGMTRHFAELRPKLKKGALLAYVVGDQASYLRVMIRTGQLLGQIAQELGYELINIDLFRTRLATATKAQLREEIVVLRWPQ